MGIPAIQRFLDASPTAQMRVWATHGIGDHAFMASAETSRSHVMFGVGDTAAEAIQDLEAQLTAQ